MADVYNKASEAIEVLTDMNGKVILLMNKNKELERKLDVATTALKYYGGIDYDSDAYLDVFDCITRISESTTDFDADTFSKRAREALKELEK